MGLNHYEVCIVWQMWLLCFLPKTSLVQTTTSILLLRYRSQALGLQKVPEAGSWTVMDSACSWLVSFHHLVLNHDDLIPLSLKWPIRGKRSKLNHVPNKQWRLYSQKSTSTSDWVCPLSEKLYRKVCGSQPNHVSRIVVCPKSEHMWSTIIEKIT